MKFSAIFNDIKNIINSVWGKPDKLNKSPDQVKKTITEACHELIETLNSVSTLLQNSEVQKLLKDIGLKAQNISGLEAALKKEYNEPVFASWVAAYYEQLRVNGNLDRKEVNGGMFATFQSVMPTIKSDIESVIKNLPKMFNGVESKDDYRVSHLAVTNYMSVIDQLLFTVTTFFILLPIKTDGSVRQNPKYYPVQDMDKKLATAAQQLNALSVAKKDFYERVIVELMRKGGDVPIYQNGKPIDMDPSLAPQLYTQELQQILANGFIGIFNPVYWYMSSVTHWQEWRSRRRAADLMFVQNRIRLLEMTASKMDPQSKEYQSTLKVMNNYRSIMDRIQKDMAAAGQEI